jgi:Type III flagellar switch regulator (C-ring) FliN C-term
MMEPASPAVLQSIILERLLGRPKDEESAAPGPSKAGKGMLSKLRASIKAGLSSKIDIELTGQQQMPLQNWLRTFGKADWIIAVPQRESDPNPVMLVLETAALSNLTSLAFGGQEPAPAGNGGRELTGLEFEFLPILADMFLPALIGLAHAPLLKPKFCSAGSFEASSVSNADAGVFQFSLSLGTMTWPLRIAWVPEIADAPAESKGSTSWKTHLSEEIGRSRLTAEAVVDLYPQTLAKLRSLRAGDVIAIPEGNLGRCALKARGEPVYSGRLGRQGDVYSFRVRAPARKSGGLAESIVKGIDRSGTANRGGIQ